MVWHAAITSISIFDNVLKSPVFLAKERTITVLFSVGSITFISKGNKENFYLAFLSLIS